MLLALQTTARLYRWDGRCVPISKHHQVKVGKTVDVTEALTMEFVGARTSIPVPRVRCAFVRKGLTYIVMERVRGVTIAAAMHKMSEAERADVFTQLRRLLNELRGLPSPSETAVQSCTGGSLYDVRIPYAQNRFGPFDTIHQFYSYIRNGFTVDDLDRMDGEAMEDRESIARMTAKQDGPWPPPVFTHADLNPHNIFVRDGRVAGIIDWEFAGWYPSYWEYTLAWYGNQVFGAWQAVLDRFLDPYPEELQMEITRQNWWGCG